MSEFTAPDWTGYPVQLRRYTPPSGNEEWMCTARQPDREGRPKHDDSWLQTAGASPSQAKTRMRDWLSEHWRQAYHREPDEYEDVL